MKQLPLVKKCEDREFSKIAFRNVLLTWACSILLVSCMFLAYSWRNERALATARLTNIAVIADQRNQAWSNLQSLGFTSDGEWSGAITAEQASAMEDGD